MKTRYLRLVKKQRGFTLIELLAVILILGIIALIAIPTVSSVVEQSRKGAAKSSASQFVVSVDELIMTSEFNGNRLEDGTYTTKDLQDRGLNIKGTMPDSGYIRIENGAVTGCYFTYGNYDIKCDGNDFSSVKSEDSTKFEINEDNDSNNDISKGDKVCLGTECFYVLSLSDDNVRMLAEWNLNVGYVFSYDGQEEFSSSLNVGKSFFVEGIGSFSSNLTATKINTKYSDIKQDSNFLGYKSQSGMKSQKGAISFAYLSQATFDEYKNYSPGYWASEGDNYPREVYNSNSFLYEYIEAYINNLKIEYGKSIISGDLVKYSEISPYCNMFSCSSSSTPKWVYQTSYWTETASSSQGIYAMMKGGMFGSYSFEQAEKYGVRPVITVSKDLIK